MLPVRLTALIALLLAGASPSFAQGVTLAARDTAVVAAAPAATVTTALRITNSTAERVSLTPRIVVPTDWSVPLGALPFALAAGESDSWILGVRVPARAPAGRYLVAITAADSSGRVVVRDSITIKVTTRRGLSLALTTRPSYAVSGEPYRAGFLLQNSGNVDTRVSVRGTSTMGSVLVDSSVVTLAAGQSVTLDTRVVSRTKGTQAEDDVIELHVGDLSDTSVVATASARVTIVQEANSSEPLHRVASQLRLRAASANAGVSPFEFVGAGALRDGGSEQVSFVMRGSAGSASQYGDQDEYRLQLTGRNYSARVGDGLYSASRLTTTGQVGFGVGAEATHGSLSAGVFAQRFRFQLDAPNEQGAFVTARRADLFGAPKVTVSGLSRSGGSLQGQVLSTAATMTPVKGTTVEMELAASTGPLGRGYARMARVSGGEAVRYELGHTAADERFAGASRAAGNNYASVSGQPVTDVAVSATIGRHTSTGALFGHIAPQSFTMATVQADYASRYSLQLTSAARESDLDGVGYDESQRGVLARTEQRVGPARVWAAGGVGVASAGTEGSHAYQEMTLGVSANMGEHSFSVFTETSLGMTITRGGGHVRTLGGNARVQIGPTTFATVNGFQASVLSLGDKYSQVDAGLSQGLPTGSTVSLRYRLTNSEREVRGRQTVFVEYAMPLQMPVGRSRSIGRVRGRVVDQETGRGVAGTLVRLGPQAAITDAEGNVVFAGLEAGEHRLTLAQQAHSATVFTGNSTIRVDSTRRVPTTFSLAIERPGVVLGNVRLMSVVRTGLESAADSVADAGPINAISLALVGVRDTLYASSDVHGAFSFNEVPSGTWMLRVTSEARPNTRWEPAEFRVTVRPAGTQEVVVRSLPRRRAVQMNSGEVITARPLQHQQRQQEK